MDPETLKIRGTSIGSIAASFLSILNLISTKDLDLGFRVQLTTVKWSELLTSMPGTLRGALSRELAN